METAGNYAAKAAEPVSRADVLLRDLKQLCDKANGVTQTAYSVRTRLSGPIPRSTGPQEEDAPVPEGVLDRIEYLENRLREELNEAQEVLQSVLEVL